MDFKVAAFFLKKSKIIKATAAAIAAAAALVVAVIVAVIVAVTSFNCFVYLLICT